MITSKYRQRLKRLMKHIKTLKQHKYFNPGAVIFALLFAGIGTYLLLGGHAATPAYYGSVNADKGSLSGSACPVTDSSATDGTAVQFGCSGGSTPVNTVAPYFCGVTSGLPGCSSVTGEA